MRKTHLSKLPKKLILAHTALLVSTLMWAIAGPVIKLTLSHIPPVTFLFFRFLIVCTLLLPYMFFELRRHKVHKKDYFNFFLLGLFSQTSLLIAFYAFEFSTVLDVTIISVMGMLLTVYAGHYFYKDEIDDNVTRGLILATIGTFIVILEPIITDGHSPVPIAERVFGNLLALIYNLTWVIYIVWSKMSMGERSTLLKKSLSKIHIRPMQKTYPAELIVAVTFYVGLITVIPFAFLEGLGYLGNVSWFNMSSIAPVGIAGLFYMAVFSSIAAYGLYQWGLEFASVSDTAIYGYLSPIFTVPFAYLLLAESPNPCMIVGSIVIAIGVIVAEQKKT